MNATLDHRFIRTQIDMFGSGLVAKIGINAFAVWSVIKCHANYNTGLCYPGIRSIAEKLDVSNSTVQRATKNLINHHML